MKKAFTVLLAALLCLSAAGCSGFLDGEYVSSVKYEDELPVLTGDALVVGSYYSLRNALLAMVDAHQAEGTLRFTGYEGEVSEDLPRVCAELKNENALCAYAVDYISYDLSLIVSYYEARVYINYLHTEQELAALKNIGTVANAQQLIFSAMQEEKTSLLFSAVGTTLTEAEVLDMAEQFYHNEPMQCLSLPHVSLSAYPRSGFSHIYELTIEYDGEAETRAEKRTELRRAAAALITQVEGESKTEQAESAARLLAQRCDWIHGSGDAINAYGALVNGRAESDGFALAYKALCNMLELDCLVVHGRMDNAPHSWNLVRLGGQYYHVDVSQASAESPVLLPVSLMRQNYWWDIEAYPAAADFAPEEQVQEAPETEPTPEPTAPQETDPVPTPENGQTPSPSPAPESPAPQTLEPQTLEPEPAP